MFSCEACGRKSERGQKQHRRVVEQRRRQYDRGLEIVRELKVGECCKDLPPDQLLTKAHSLPAITGRLSCSGPGFQNVKPPKHVQQRLAAFLLGEVVRKS
jgi:hypothetical protein